MFTLTAITLWRQITPWLLLLLALAVLALALGFDRYAAHQAVDAQERQRLVVGANAVQENLSARMRTTSHALEALRADLRWLLAQPEGLSLLNRRLAALVAATEGLRTLLVVDANGIATASNRQELIGMNFRDQERYRTMGRDANPDTLYVSAPFRTPLGIWAVSLGRVIIDDKGRFNGYVLAILDPDYFRLLLTSTLYAPDMRVSLIHGDGKVIFRAPDPEGLTGQDVLERPESFFRRYLDSGADRLVLEGPSAAPGGERLAALQAILPQQTPADKPLVIAASRDLAAIFVPWRQETLVRLELFALIALVAVFGLFAYQRRQRAYDRWRATEEARREEAEARLRLAVEGAELGTWYWNIVTNGLEWSDRCKAHLALPAGQEPSFDHFYAVIHQEDRSRVEELQRLAIEQGNQFAAEYRVNHPDGSEHWLNAHGRVYRAGDGTSIGMGGITQEITARKQTEANLQESERRFRELFEHLPIAYQSVDSAGRWLDANQKMADLLGFSRPEDMIGLSFVDYWDSSIRDQFDASYERFKANLSIDGEVPLRRRDGTPLTILFSGRIQRDDQGRFLRTHCILIDITERRVMEDQIRDLNNTLEQKVADRTAALEGAQAELQQALARLGRSGARLRTMFEQAPLGIALIDSLSGQIIEVNGRFAAIAGRGREEMATIDWMKITHPDDVQLDLDNMARLNAGEISGFQMNKRYLHPDGAVVWISMTIAPVTREPGEGPRHLCMIEDITERIQNEQRIQETLGLLQEARRAAEAASLAKGEFLAHMSHEIRTPLNAVLGQTQLLGREPLNAVQLTMVQRLQAAGQSLLGIINDILDFSKLEAGQLRLESRPFRLETLITKVDSLLGPTARAKGLDLHFASPPVGLLQGDPLRLEQVLTNLLGNAIKFTERGEVRVNITPLAENDQGLGLRFAIQDTGIGIAPAARERLFSAFSQADTSITRRFGGTGLGLSICKRLVEMMGGEIGVESAPGQGSTFWFELAFPHATASAPVEQEPPPAPLAAGPRLAGLRLLAVDDSAMNRDLVEQVLIREGASVTLAGDGQQAVQLLQAPSHGFDAVLMDVQMPVMDGRTATRLIRGPLGLTQLPIIALTAGVLADEQRLIRAAGADEVLPKPLDLEQLVATLLRLVPADRREAAASDLAPQVSPTAVATTGPVASPVKIATTGSVASSVEVATTASLASAVEVASAGPEARPAPIGGAPLTPPPGLDSPDAFPLVPGIDPARAALITGQDPAFFLALLERLLKESAGAGEDCRLALAGGDWEKAARRMHSLKGNAGNLGALNLMQAAAALEVAIQQGARDLDAGLAALDRQLQDLAAASAPWLAAAQRAQTQEAGTRQPEKQPTGAAPAPVQARTDDSPSALSAKATVSPLEPAPLAALRDALKRHNLAAMDLYEELEPALIAAWGPEATQIFGQAIANLQFGEALAQFDLRIQHQPEERLI